ncbi:MAG: hypothetical protein HQL44_08170 [Alphaproteobacteria bacterium]|nr:hypothetical protein [Alphaproteobacteria bacterium]
MPHRRAPPHVRLASQGGRETRLAGIFLLGMGLFLPPWLSIFNRDETVFGIPLLYLYLFLAWGALIILIARALSRGQDGGQE